MKVLLLTMNRSDATSFYRASGVVRDLEKQAGATIDTYNWNQIPLTWDILTQYDIVWMQRPVMREAVNSAGYLKLMGKPLWIDWDDDLFNIPQTHTNYMTFAQNRENIISLIQLADVVTVSTQAIADSYSPYSANIRIVPNAVQDAMLQPFTGTRTNTLFYRGLKSHEDDIYYFSQHFRKLIEEGRNVKFMGVNPARYVPRATIIGEREIYNYLKYVRDLKPLAFLFPMVDNPFNRSRSNIAWLESTMAGSITIAPNWPEWQHKGIIHCTPDNFYAVATSVANGDVDVDRLYKVSYEYIADNLRLSIVNKQRVHVLKDLS